LEASSFWWKGFQPHQRRLPERPGLAAPNKSGNHRFWNNSNVETKMNATQFKVVKFMLDFPTITPPILVKAWNNLGTKITLEEVNKAAVSRDHKHYTEIPEEDVSLLMKNLFGV
jgi:hypothetical protein